MGGKDKKEEEGRERGEKQERSEERMRAQKVDETDTRA